MKKRIATLCDTLMTEADKTFGNWEVTIGSMILFLLGALSFFFHPELSDVLFVYLQYKFWSTVFFVVSLGLKKKGQHHFDICTIAVLIQMLDVAVLLGYLYCLKGIFPQEDFK